MQFRNKEQQVRIRNSAVVILTLSALSDGSKDLRKTEIQSSNMNKKQGWWNNVEYGIKYKNLK